MADPAPAPSQYKKKIKPGAIELDPNEPTIVVHYTTQTIDPAQLDAQGKPIVISSEQDSKRIKLKSFTVNSTVEKFADAIVKQCAYIHSSKIPHVCQLLEQLKQRLQGGSNGAPGGAAVQQPQPAPVATPPAAAASINTDPAQQRPRTAAGSRPTTTPAQPPIQPTTPLTATNGSSRESTPQAATPAAAPARTTTPKFDNTALIQKASKTLHKQLKTERKQLQADYNDTKIKYKQIDKYTEELYEDHIERKIHACKCILTLCSATALGSDKANNSSLQHIQAIVQDHSQVLSTLARILTEDSKKHLELTATIIHVFTCFSRYIQLQQSTVTTNKIGLTVMKIIEYELQRYSIRSKAFALRVDVGNATEEDHLTYAQFLTQQQRVLTVAFTLLLHLSDDLQLEYKIVQKNIIPLVMQCFTHRNDYHTPTLDAYFTVLCRYVWKLSVIQENITLIWSDSKAWMSILQHVLSDKSELSDATILYLLHFLINSSFTPAVKYMLLHTRIFPTLLNTLQRPNGNIRATMIKLLYNLSYSSTNTADDTTESLSRYPLNRLWHKSNLHCNLQPMLQLLTTLILKCPNKHVDSELVALAINITMYSPIQMVVQLLSGDVLQQVLKRVCHTGSSDALLVKWCATIALVVNTQLVQLQQQPQQPTDVAPAQQFAAQLSQYQSVLYRHCHEYCSLIVKAAQTQAADFQLHAVQLFNTVCTGQQQLEEISDTPPGASTISYYDLCVNHRLIDYMNLMLRLGATEDDLLLANIQMLATVMSDERVATLVVNSRITQQLYELLLEKYIDIDITVQLLWLAYKLLLHPTTRQVIEMYDELITAILDLSLDQSEPISTASNQCVNVLVEFGDRTVRERIATHRFEQYNSHWLVSVGCMASNTDEDYENHILPRGSTLVAKAANWRMNGSDQELEDSDVPY